ncbi:MAG: single-stranded DNA-binding protein [Defluviitaleaceae bacterium]|nr:single-stranded DNA-binding protein [Defluviitaleaceae bacterium]
MNRVILVGRLARDPEIRYSNQAEPMAIARYTLAVNRRFRREGEPDADFINCTCFRRDAEFAEKHLRKGMQVSVTGRLQIRQYEQNGQRQYYTEVVLDEQNFTESKSAYEARIANQGQSPYAQGQGQYGPPKPLPQAAPPPTHEDDSFFAPDQSLDDDDLPF